MKHILWIKLMLYVFFDDDDTYKERFLPNSKNCCALHTHENAHKDRIDVIIHLLMVVVNKRQ